MLQSKTRQFFWYSVVLSVVVSLQGLQLSALSEPLAQTQQFLNTAELIRNACVKTLDVRFQAQFPPEKLTGYCDCSARKITAQLSMDDLLRIQAAGIQNTLDNPNFREPVQQCLTDHLLSN